MKNLICLIEIIATIALCGCSPKHDGGGGGGNSGQTPEDPMPPVAELNYKLISRLIFSEYCLPCHTGNSPLTDLRLDSYNALRAQPQYLGDSRDNSSIYQAVASGDMPPRGDLVPADLLELLGAWIDLGAPEE